MGIGEILIIAIVAIIALGPDKLPTAMVQIAKTFNKIKNGLSEAKDTLDKELNIAELKNEANKFKAQLENTKTSLNSETKIDLGLDKILNDDFETSPKKTLKKEIKEDKDEKNSSKNKANV